MRLVILSDTHSYHRRVKVPDGDVLIHCGDISWRGEIDILQDFADWTKELPHPNKVVIFGNHEVGARYSSKRDRMLSMIRDASIHYLEDSSVEIDGIHFYGSPFSPEYCNWEFGYRRGKEAKEKWSAINENTNVLVSHGPPYMILDEAPRGISSFENVGCKDQIERIDYLSKLGNLKVHCFGHIHRDNFEQPVDRFGVKFCNASICNNAYVPVNEPVVVDI